MLTSCGNSKSEENVVTIGAPVDFTGSSSASGQLVYEGIQAVEEYFSQQGGITINGQKYSVKFTAEDTKSTADGSVAAVKKLVNDDGLKIIVGQSTPYQISAANTITGPAKVINGVMYNTMTPGELGPDFPYTFLIGGGGAVDAVTGLLTYGGNNYKDIKTVTIIIPDDGQIPYMEPVVKKIAEAQGWTVLDTIGWATSTVDFTPIAQKALAKNPDAIAMTTGWPGMIGSILQLVRQAGFEGLVMGTNPAEDILAVAGAEASTNYIGIGDTPTDPNLPAKAKEFGQIVQNKFGHCLFYNLWACNAYYTIVGIVEGAQSTDPTAIKNYWENAQAIDSIWGTCPMGGLETYGVRHDVIMPVPICGLTNGQATFLSWQEITVP